MRACPATDDKAESPMDQTLTPRINFATRLPAYWTLRFWQCLLRSVSIPEVFAQDAQHTSQGFRGAPEQLIANRKGP
jgi:hypothetical protein